jgi:putative oxidoreductase
MGSVLRLVFGGAKLECVGAELMIALPRFAFGVMMPLYFGLSKFPVPQWFIDDVGKLGFPVPFVFAWAAVLTEVVGSFMLALGLCTRVVAALLVFTMGVAAFVQKGDAELWQKLPSLCFMVNAWFAMVLGSGRFGLDEIIRRKWVRGA